jgi:hypothetical protein
MQGTATFPNGTKYVGSVCLRLLARAPVLIFLQWKAGQKSGQGVQTCAAPHFPAKAVCDAFADTALQKRMMALGRQISAMASASKSALTPAAMRVAGRA